MQKRERFIQHIQQGNHFKGESVILGGAMLDGTPQPGALVRLPLKTLNRHGLIAGATGTGKTVTVQVLAEQLSQHGVPSLVMDLKGDLSGLAKAGRTNPHIQERHQHIGIPYSATAMPVEFLSSLRSRAFSYERPFPSLAQSFFLKFWDSTTPRPAF
ncbi:MAG: helicase HerA-like domain-containing protein [Fodinibius sp.]|nr:helicase HerA-like domain-containing protein [Fodinibius sp.]